jgi:hypothetical protein
MVPRLYRRRQEFSAGEAGAEDLRARKPLPYRRIVSWARDILLDPDFVGFTAEVIMRLGRDDAA